jgi:hypothetical protein
LSGYRKILVAALICAVAAGVVLLFFYNPAGNVWFPKCWFHELTGWECPACGSQRALHQLLHLNFGKAFSYNPFMIISVPYVIALGVVTWGPKTRFERLRKFCYDRRTVYVYIVLLVAWWIGRNLY